jgi:hypothetical protein
MEVIKACRCGGQPVCVDAPSEEIKGGEASFRIVWRIVKCPDCGLTSGRHRTPQEAIKEWN